MDSRAGKSPRAMMNETGGAHIVWTMDTPIRVEKCKWDGGVSSCEPAHLVTSAPSVQAWFVPVGTTRARPTRGTTESVGSDELWVTAADEWWVLCASAQGDDITDLVLHAAAPVEPAVDDVVIWIDLDLDLELHGDRMSLEDIDVFHDHTVKMGYPNNVIRGAWSGISHVGPRYTTHEWPFDGGLYDLLRLARLELEPGRQPSWRLERRLRRPAVDW